VHNGHQSVINTAKDVADRLGAPLCVYTFSKPPKSFFSSVPVPQVCTTEDKHDLLENLGVDIIVNVEPSLEIFSMTAEDFVTEVLLKDLKASHIVCGFNYAFGKGGKGNVELLKGICAENGIGLTVCPPFIIDGINVSSSAIRDAVSAGNTSLAKKLLGRPFSINAEVVNGQHLARKLGFPTVNIIPNESLVLPKSGVYLTQVLFDGEYKYGITNIGLRPTVDTNILCAETHIFDFDGDIYGKKITVEFLEFIRREMKFPSVDDMAKQAKTDIITAKKHLNK
jgi:riboflavin kinase/FMN adenylyltransferase